MIEVLDQHREVIVNWVHLRADANRMIASAFASKILELLGARVTSRQLASHRPTTNGPPRQ